MNCIEKLSVIHRICEPCKAKIIDFECLSGDLKYEVDFYDKDYDYLIFCESCNEYRLIQGENQLSKYLGQP